MLWKDVGSLINKFLKKIPDTFEVKYPEKASLSNQYLALYGSLVIQIILNREKEN